jgi:VWFA-related protein
LQVDEQEPVKTFTEEVRLPIFATNDYGFYDPAVDLKDVLVLEDRVQQEVKSIQHLPANVLLLLDVSNQITLAKSTTTTRQIAMKLILNLHGGDQVCVIQFADKVEILQDWTADREPIEKVLSTKMFAGKKSRLSDAIVASVAQLKNKPIGTRQVVMITDGVETPGSKIALEDAVRQLLAAQVTVHIISYTEMVRNAIAERNGSSPMRGGGSQRESIPGGDPTMPPGQTRSPSVRIATIDLDRAMRKWYKKYSDDTKRAEKVLTTIAEETGGRIYLPKSSEEMIKEGGEVAREIGAQYVITYKPKRPLAAARIGEYRKIEVAARRTGLHLRTRRGYVVTPGTM